MNTFTCPKCSSTVTETCSAYSNSTDRGASYTYTRCVLCGFVRHHLDAREMREHREIVGDAQIRAKVNVVYTRVIPRSKILSYSGV